ncbi:MAG: ABC transporter ATP-binding protein/permease [Nitrospinota bacterium]|nr:ABC transporter ATP-binding protein/permease [Nitrospinota bacterium]
MRGVSRGGLGNVAFVLLRTWGYLIPHVGAIIVTWVISVMVIAIQAVSVWIGAEFINKILRLDITSPSSTNAIPSGKVAVFLDQAVAGALTRATHYETLVASVAALFLLGVMMALIRVVKLYIIASVNQQILFTIRNALFSRLTLLNLSFSRINRPGEVASLFIQDVNQLNYLFIDAADRVFMQPMRLAVAMFLMASISPELTLMALAILLPGGAIIHIVGVRIHSLTGRMMEKVALVQGHLTEYLSTVILARALSREDMERKKFDRETDANRKLMVKVMLMDAMAPQVVNILFIVATSALLIIGGRAVLVEGTITSGDLIKLSLLLPMVTNPLEALATLYVSYQSSSACALRVFRFLDHEKKPFPEGEKQVGRPLESVTLEKVSYGVDATDILTDISFSIPAGAMLAVYGPSGSGKTTMLALLAKFDVCREGAVRIDGEDIKHLDGIHWRKSLGIVTQEPLLINGAIRENLLYARPDATESQMIEALTRASLWSGEGSYLPSGLDTEVGNRGDMLSGGERQRLTIARATLHDPGMMLIDEPTSQLDQESRMAIRQTLLNLKKGRTIVVATHDKMIRDIADFEARMENGRLVHFGKRENYDNG